jgi:DNA-binding NtrC family response regulator
MSTILLVDDDSSVLASLGLLLKQAGYGSAAASTPAEALGLLEAKPIDLVIQDMNFTRNTTGEEGLALLEQIRARKHALPVILMTGWGSIALAVKGVRAGASDFITKPWTNEQLLQSVETALGLAKVNAFVAARAVSREELDTKYDFSAIIGNDPALVAALEIAGRISSTDASVLITGESGTGKELVAEAIHRNSLRRNGPFVKVNIGGMPPALFDSEMFGHVRGAFTDARADRKGRFEISNTGTIFLDEIGELDPGCQVKLLRVLQDRTYEMVGSSETRSVNVRVVSATNARLSELIEREKFREDLLYRLNLITIQLPPLRERRGDIPLLAGYFLQSAANAYTRKRLAITEDAMRWLQRSQWSGNIRQLKQLIERTVLISSSETLGVAEFESSLSMEHPVETKKPGDAIPASGVTLEEMEKAMILRAMDQHRNNISKVADALGLSRAALYRRLEKFGIKT